MKSANQITILMLALAAVSVVTAMYFYPWPELAVADEIVGKPLFEEYAVDKVRGIDIVELDDESRTPTRIQLGRRAENWVIPSRQNFVATNSLLVGNVVNSLNGRTVYDVVSENAQDHIQYGVVDPDEFTLTQNLEAAGKKIVLTDRNSKKIAELIIGSKLKDDPEKRYVRIPGKPRIFLIDFNDQLLQTQFTYWVTPNPLQLKTSDETPGLTIAALRIQKNRPAAGEEQSGVTPVYDARISAGKQRMEIDYLRTPSNDDQQTGWKTIQTTPEQEARLVSALRGLYPLPTDDVRRKRSGPANALKNPTDAANDAFKDFPSYGFYAPTAEQGRWTFVAENGTVSISTREGVLLDVHLGKPGNQNSTSKASFNHFLMINASVDHQQFTEPQRPAGLADDDSEENKQFRRRLDTWKEAVQAAERLADDLNALHADWFYLVSEEIVQRLLPEIPIPTGSVTQPDSSPADSPDNVNTQSPQEDSESDQDNSKDSGTKSSAVDKN